MKIVLCGKKEEGCCAEAFLHDDALSIKDEDGNIATITYEQFEMLKEKINRYNG